MPLPPFLAAVVGWLRAGYPEGVPEVDYIPLFALLGSERLTGDPPETDRRRGNAGPGDVTRAVRGRRG